MSTGTLDTHTALLLKRSDGHKLELSGFWLLSTGKVQARVLRTGFAGNCSRFWFYSSSPQEDRTQHLGATKVQSAASTQLHRTGCKLVPC